MLQRRGRMLVQERCHKVARIADCIRAPATRGNNRTLGAGKTYDASVQQPGMAPSFRAIVAIMFESYIKPATEFLAFLGAALFFGFKLFSGFFICNLSVSLKCDRRPSKSGTNDFLTITASLKKGDMSALKLHDMQAQVSHGSTTQCVPFHGILRTSYRTERTGKSTCRKVATLEKVSQTAPLLNLVPGEETSFACGVDVPAGVTVRVEVVVLGKRAYAGWKVGQWRASAVVPPSDDHYPAPSLNGRGAARQ